MKSKVYRQVVSITTQEKNTKFPIPKWKLKGITSSLRKFYNKMFRILKKDQIFKNLLADLF